MAITWPSGGPPASDIDFRTIFLKETLIPNTKWILEAQLGSSQTMYGAGNGPKLAICGSFISNMGKYPLSEKCFFGLK